MQECNIDCNPIPKKVSTEKKILFLSLIFFYFDDLRMRTGQKYCSRPHITDITIRSTNRVPLSYCQLRGICDNLTKISLKSHQSHWKNLWFKEPVSLEK